MEEQAGLDTIEADQASFEFLGQWHGLISTTNWEKGRIVHQWRETLRESGASSSQYSDEAWSRRVGQVSGQHIGRLRRVYERFGSIRHDFAGLFWSHFQAALEWPEAEMWLEGAVQNGWSVADMRASRAQTLGMPGQASDDEDVPTEFDEDFVPPESDLSYVRDPGERAREKNLATARAASQDADPISYEIDLADSAVAVDDVAARGDSAEAPFRPFQNLPKLPDDLSEAFESLKLAILRHKLDAWREVRRDDVVATLDAFKQMTISA